MFFTCLSVGAVRATFVFSMSWRWVFHRGVRYRNDMAAQAATKSLPRAVPEATDVRGLNWTLDKISCCSLSRVTPRPSRTNRFQSSLHERIRSMPRCRNMSLFLFIVIHDAALNEECRKTHIARNIFLFGGIQAEQLPAFCKLLSDFRNV